MFDVFYSGTAPGLFAHERVADSIEHAKTLCRTEYFWWVTYLADLEHWDFVWTPPPWQSHQRHAWPSQWQKDSGVYLVPKNWDGKETNYHSAPTVPRQADPASWLIPEHVVGWDQSWHPDPSEPSYLHEFATQWHDRGGPVYVMSGAQHKKYHLQPQACLAPSDNNWVLLTECAVDRSWQPHPNDPPYIYVFGNQWWPAEIMPTAEYRVLGATERKFMTHPRARLLERPHAPWKFLTPCDWDTSWQPDPGDPPYIYVFGNQWWPAEIMPTVEYHTPGACERKYMSWPRAVLPACNKNWTVPKGLSDVDLSWQPDPGDPPYIYQFGTQWQSTGGPVYTVPGATEVKYVSWPRATKVSVDPFWSVPEGVDTESFDWTWHPDSNDGAYIYQFGTQHQRTGGPVYTVPGATEVKYVDQIRIRTQPGAAAVIEIDHLDGSAGQIPNTVKRARYFDNYRDTLIRIAKSLGPEHEYVWICSSICDYSNFDFSWHPEQWQATMLHVFASNDQKFGDTFFMHVPTFAARAERCALLEWYDVNFVPVSVARRSLPVIKHQHDTHVEQVKTTEWSGPLALFTVDSVPVTMPTVSLWRQETKNIVPLSAGASAVIVPKTAKADIRTQLYDYPFIDKTQRRQHSDHPLDIVFISNGERNASDHWTTLVNHVGNRPNRVVHVSGIKGRVAAYHAAAQASTTPWFFAVFAKLEVDANFDWSWQPDRMQQPKHYIFHAKNPVNGLVYGHQAMIAYNRDLVLANPGHGLDFTLDSEHEVVPIMSGIARYNDTPWMTWRTAFREVLKLCASCDVESKYRLDKWRENGQGPNCEWSMRGAQDAVEYFESVNGEFNQLRNSYDWDWLASYAMRKRNLTPD